jgi:integrase
MASIEKRVRNGRAYYRARYRDPSGRQRNKTFRRKVDAEKYLALIEAAKVRGTWTDPAHGKITLAAWLETWWGSAADLRPSTKARDRAYLNSLVLPRFGTTPLAAITQPDVQAWVAHLTARGFAPATVIKAYQLLGRTLTAAVNADMIPRSPCRAVRLPKIEREEMRFLNPAEVARLADAIHSRYRALVLLGAYGGLRMGELAGLRRGRVDLLSGTVDVAEIVVEVHGQLYTGPPKTRAGRRTVGLPRAVVEELAAHRGRSARPTPTSSLPSGVGRFGPRTSASRSGSLPCARPAWRHCARTTFATPRSHCGSRRAPTPRRSASGPATRL